MTESFIKGGGANVSCFKVSGVEVSNLKEPEIFSIGNMKGCLKKGVGGECGVFYTFCQKYQFIVDPPEKV